MNTFCSIINNGYSSNYKVVNLPFKKKYIYLLNKLIKYNYILNYKIYLKLNKIEVYLKYYKNKPLFNLKIESTNSNKQYLKIFKIKNKNNGFNINFFSTNLGFLLTDEVLLKNIGGNKILKLNFFNVK